MTFSDDPTVNAECQRVYEEIRRRMLLQAAENNVKFGREDWGVRRNREDFWEVDPDGTCCAIGATLADKKFRLTAINDAADELEIPYLSAYRISEGFESLDDDFVMFNHEERSWRRVGYALAQEFVDNQIISSV